MPALQTTAGYLNAAFGPENIGGIAGRRNAFAPGKTLSSGLSAILDKHTPLFNALVPYIDNLPGSIQESLRSTIFYALSTAPPTHVTFAWAPGYDYELTIWHATGYQCYPGGNHSAAERPLSERCASDCPPSELTAKQSDLTGQR